MAVGKVPIAITSLSYLGGVVTREGNSRATDYNAVVYVGHNLLNLSWQVRIGCDSFVYEISDSPYAYHYTEDALMKKKELIRLIDSLLFANLQIKMVRLYREAKSINDGVSFKYHFFTETNANSLPPSEATINFLFKYVVELKPAIENRQAVNFLIIRFLNECYEAYSVLHLLPPKALPANLLSVLNDTSFGTADTELIARFKEEPSYNLIKRQVVFNTME